METKENLVEAAELDVRKNESATAVAAEAQTETATPAEGKEDAAGTHQEHVREALELLYNLFPKAFIREGNCKPLKIGILEDLKTRTGSEAGLSISKLRAAVRVYTTRLRYFYAVREGVMRVDLDGNEVEAVTAEHAEYARTRFTEINAGRQPQRNTKKPGRPFNRNNRHNNTNEGGESSNGEQRHNRFNNNNRRPNNGNGTGNNQNRGRFNREPRRYEPAKESDIKVGRYVFISADHSYRKATIVEELHGDTVKLDLQSGMSVTMPLSRLFVSVSSNRPHRSFDRNNRGPRRDDHRRNGDFKKSHGGADHGDRAAKE